MHCFEIFAFKKYYDLETWFEVIRGHWKTTPVDRSHDFLLMFNSY